VKRSLWIVLALVVAAGCGSSGDPVSEKPKANPETPTSAVGGKEVRTSAGPDLLLADSSAAPALLDGPEGIQTPPRRTRGKEADNDRCHVCHINFSEERLAVGHAWADVGCEKCHGPSDAHCGDEGNITPPTTLFAKADIDKSCKVCHPDDRFVEDAKSCPIVVDDSKGPKYCTDCHGRHRMERRTVHWDKKTGKLLPKVVEKG